MTLSDRPTEPIGAVIAGRYHLVEKVGEGGYSIVYRAKVAGKSTCVAVKLVRPNFDTETNRTILQRFYREALLTSALTHPNTLTPIDYGRTSAGTAYIVMSFLEGESVGDVLDRGETFSQAATQRIILDVLRSLEEAHAHGIAHADIKGSNIFLEEHREHARVLDFGVATIITDVELSDQIFGTPHYLAPEVALGRGVRPESDIYSLGITAWEMLHGFPPFHADALPQLLRAHVAQPLPTLPHELRGTALGRFIQHATAKSAGARPTASEAIAMLSDAADVNLSRSPEIPFTRMVTGDHAVVRTHGGLETAANLPYFERDESLPRVQRALQTMASHGGGVLIEGPLGVGKRRLITESVDGEPALTTRARTDRVDGHVAIFSFFDALAAHHFERGDAVVATTLKAIADGLRADPNHLQTLGDEATTAVFEAARRSPLRWIITELEYADPPALRFIIRLFDQLENVDAGLLMILTLSNDQPFASRTLQFFRRNVASGVWPHVVHVRLAPLTEHQMRAFVSSLGSPTEQVLSLLVSRARGIPGRLRSLLTTGIEQGVLLEEHGRLVQTLRGNTRKLVDEVWDAPPLNERIRALIEANDLGDVLATVSLLGPHFCETTARDTLRHIEETTGQDLQDAFDRSLDQNVLTRNDEGRLCFLSHDIGVEIRQRLTPDARQARVAAADRALSRVARHPTDFEHIASLRAEVGDLEGASLAASNGAGIAERQGDMGTADRLYRKALDRPWTDADTNTRHQLVLGQCRVLARRGDFAAATETLVALLNEPQLTEATELEILLTLSRFASERGDMASVAERIQRIMKLARGPQTPAALLVDALLVVGDFGLATGNHKQAARAYIDAEKRASRADAQTRRARARVGIARCLARERKLKQADRFLTEAIDYLRQSGDHDLLVEALIDRGNVRFGAAGNASQAAFDEAITLAETHDRPALLADILVGQARVMQRNRHTEAATILLMRALERFRRLYHTRGEAKTLRLLAECAIENQQLAAAATYIQESIDCYRSTRDVMGAAQAHIVASEVHWLNHRFDVAAAEAQRSANAYRNLGGRYGEARALLLCGRALASGGDARSAEVAFAQAELLAARISNATLQEALTEARQTDWPAYVEGR